VQVAGTPHGKTYRYLKFGENWLRQLFIRCQVPLPAGRNLDLTTMDPAVGGPYALVAFDSADEMDHAIDALHEAESPPPPYMDVRELVLVHIVRLAPLDEHTTAIARLPLTVVPPQRMRSRCKTLSANTSRRQLEPPPQLPAGFARPPPPPPLPPPAPPPPLPRAAAVGMDRDTKTNENMLHSFEWRSESERSVATKPRPSSPASVDGASMLSKGVEADRIYLPRGAQFARLEFRRSESPPRLRELKIRRSEPPQPTSLRVVPCLPKHWVGDSTVPVLLDLMSTFQADDSQLAGWNALFGGPLVMGVRGGLS